MKRPRTTARQLGEVKDYDSLIWALRNRADELQLSGETIDEAAGLPERYVSKLFGKAQVRRFGMVSLGLVLTVLGLKLVVVEDPEAISKCLKLKKRVECCVRGERRKGHPKAA